MIEVLNTIIKGEKQKNILFDYPYIKISLTENLEITAFLYSFSQKYVFLFACFLYL